jgi:hypothetical protein
MNLASLCSYKIQNLTACVDFNFQVVEHGLGHLPFTEKQVVTPTGVFFFFFTSFNQ